ncbi:MAG: type II toxin-antitoxin system HicB family antitoxin [Rhodothermales bacterium]
MLTEYIQAALRQAKYEILPEDNEYYGEVPALQGVWATGDTLEDVRLQVSVEEGVLGFLGSNSRIHIRDRVVDVPSAPSPAEASHTYVVSATLHVRFYVLGLKVRDRRYGLEDVVETASGLRRQVLTSPDGSYVALERRDALDERWRPSARPPNQ